MLWIVAAGRDSWNFPCNTLTHYIPGKHEIAPQSLNEISSTQVPVEIALEQLDHPCSHALPLENTDH